MRLLTLTLTGLICASAPGMAQTMTPPPTGASQLEQVGLTPPTIMSEGRAVGGEEMMASTIIGRTIYSSAEAGAETIGTVRDLVVGPLGDVTAAVLGVDGKDVAINFSDIVRVPAEDGSVRWTLDATIEAINAAPAFVYPEASIDVAPLSETEEAAQLQPGDPNAAPVDPALTTDQPTATPAERPEITLPAPTVDQLLGMPVFGQDDQPIGTIGTVIETPEGTVDALVIDVGGFLGLGAKPVAIAYENLTFASDTSGGQYLYLNTTREALEAQAPYDPATYEADRVSQRMVVLP